MRIHPWVQAILVGSVLTLSCRVAASTTPSASSTEVASPEAPPSIEASSEIAALQIKVNGLRRSQGARDLDFPAALQQIALARALDLASRDALDHGETDGTPAVLRMLESAGCSGRAAEHVLRVTDGGASFASTVLRAWVSDRAHQADLLDPVYGAAGIGMAASAEGWIVVQVLVERAAEEVAP